MSINDYLNSPDLEFRVTAPSGEMVEFHLGQLLDFKFETLNEELTNHVGKACMVDMLLEGVQSELAAIERNLKRHTASLFIGLKDSDLKYTEKRIESEIALNPQVIEMENRISELTSMKNRLQAAVRRMTERKDLMQTYSSNQRTVNI